VRHRVQRVWLVGSHTPSKGVLAFTCGTCRMDGEPLIDLGELQTLTVGAAEDTGRAAWAGMTVPERRALVASWPEPAAREETSV
jgi:hypothetical protein